MTMVCKSCRSEIREEIDQALVSGEALRDIAGQEGAPTKSSLARHREHVLPSVVATHQAQELVRGDGLLTEAVAVLDKAASILKDAESAGDRRAALGALRECRACIELLSKLKPEPEFTHELVPSPLQMAQLTKLAAEEFVGRPRLADQFAHDLVAAFFATLKDYIPRLGPGAGGRLAAKIRALDEEAA